MSSPRKTAPSLKDRLPRHVYRAYRRLHFLACYEALMRAFWPAITLVVLFAALSVWGLFENLSLLPHALIFAVFTLALAVFVWRGARVLRIPGQAELLARLEVQSQLENAPLYTLADRLPEGATPEEASLWRLWQERLRHRIGSVRTGYPSIYLAPRDPFALRFIPALLLSAGLILYFNEAPERLKSAFTFELSASAPMDVTAWVEPPEYTRLPVIYLTETEDAVAVPAGSRLRVQVNGGGGTRLATREGDLESHVEPTRAKAGEAEAYAVTLKKSMTGVRVMRGADVVRNWPLEVRGDAPPTITLTSEPGFALSGALQLSYEMQDDYGVTSASASFSSGEEATDPHVLVEPPVLPLVVPGAGAGTGRTFKDLSSSPWAGEPLTLVLKAIDAAGQTGASEAVEVTLPPRQFQNPYAREIVRLRQALALDRREETSVLAGLMQILNNMAASETAVTAFTGLSQAFWRLQFARDDDTRRSALDLMWQVALDLEGDAGALAAENMRRAQEELREALRNNASPDEIAEKVEALRRAIAEFLASQPQMQMTPQQMQAMPQMEMRDISQMLNDMQALAESGAREQAEQLLSNLEAMLENLQSMQAMQMQNPAMQALQQLQDLMRQQQSLRDQTYQQDNQDGMSAEEMQQALNELAKQQGDLAEMLRQMMNEMQAQQPGEGEAPGEGQQPGQGQQPGEGMSPALSEALRQMMQSQGQLGEGDAPGSGQSQNDALQALREAGQQMLNAMAGQQPGQGPGSTGFMPGAAPSANRDPLGRENGGFRQDGVELPTESEAERVRELLQELRQRLSAPGLERPDEDYIERLLRY